MPPRVRLFHSSRLQMQRQDCCLSTVMERSVMTVLCEQTIDKSCYAIR